MLRSLFERTWSVYWQARAPEIFRALDLNSQQRVLEIGCGSGLWTEVFAESAGTVVAMDIEQAKVREAAQRCPPEVHFLVASVLALPFQPAVFDKASCIDVIENIPDDQGAIAEMARVLRPYGALVVSILRRGRWSPLGQLRFDEYVREYTSEEFRSLFTNGGWRIRAGFDFYRRFGTLAREGQMLLTGSTLLRWVPGLRLLLWIGGAGLLKLDQFSHMPGGGLGLLVEKDSE